MATLFIQIEFYTIGRVKREEKVWIRFDHWLSERPTTDDLETYTTCKFIK